MQGDKKKKWEFAPVKDAVDKEEVPTWDPSTVPQWTPPEETAADRRGPAASAEDWANPKIPSSSPLPTAAAKPALKKGGDPKGCVKALGQSMSSDAWCVENCALPDSAELCTTDLCTCGDVHTVPQAIFPGGDPKTCTAVEGQMESNDAWCVNNCDVENWKNQAPECPTTLCQCANSGDPKKKWEIKAPEKWDPSSIPAPYVPAG